MYYPENGSPRDPQRDDPFAGTSGNATYGSYGFVSGGSSVSTYQDPFASAGQSYSYGTMAGYPQQNPSYVAQPPIYGTAESLARNGYGQYGYSAATNDLAYLDRFDLGVSYEDRAADPFSAEGDAALLPFTSQMGDDLSDAGSHSRFASAQTALSYAERSLESVPASLQVMNGMLNLENITSESELIPELDGYMGQIKSRSVARNRGKLVQWLQYVGQLFTAHKRTAIMGGAVSGAVFAALVLMLAIGVFDGSIRYVRAKEVYFDGSPVGAITDAEGLESIVSGIYSELSAECGTKVVESQLLEMRDARVDPKYVCAPEVVGERIRRNIDAQISAAVIYIDGHPAVALAGQEDADWILEEIRAPYAGDGTEEVSFIEDVTVEATNVSFDRILDRDAAYLLVSRGLQEDEVYTAAAGDTLDAVAAQTGKTAEELAAVNGLAADAVLEGGTKLALVPQQSLINVGYKEIITEHKEIPYDTEYVKDGSLYIGQTRTTVAGVPGDKELTVEVRYINGEEVSRTVLAENVITDPTNRVVAQGTAKFPTLVQGVSSYGFMTPTVGTLTSPFGPRWGRFHYGIDLANSIGTPVRASKAGTVSFAGWSGAYGYLVEISHGNGETTRYGHNSQILVSEGQYVAQGEVISLMGSTGQSTGPHCHFEIRFGGTAVDPVKYL